MGKLTLALIALFALFGTVDFASARDGCGRGFFWNGYRCAPMVREYYGPPRAYGGAACYWYYGRRICCPRGFTVQDGVCKPYRGY
jgi:hypothetical protein